MKALGVGIGIATLVAITGAANAQSRSIVVQEAPASQSSAAIEAFWTPERLTRAKPMNLRPAAGFVPKSADGTAAPSRFQQVTTDPGDGDGDAMPNNILHQPKKASGEDEVAPAASM